EATAADRRDALIAFLDASFQTKETMLSDDAIWELLKPQMDVGADAGLFADLRDGYRAGIVTHYDSHDTSAAAAAFALLAEFGTPSDAGSMPNLTFEVFWGGYRR